jgi:hypothetical protein
MAQPHHIISIGTDGFGWSGLGRAFDWDEGKSGVKDHTDSVAKLNVNYSYVFESRLMIGLEVDFKSTNSELKPTTGVKTKSETTDTEFGLSLGYNFNEDVYNSWWIKGVIASGRHDEETKDSSGTDKFKYDYSAFYLRFGKRFNLASWGLKNVSYNPSISVGSAKVSGDAEDAGLDRATLVQLDLIKIDILF